MAKRFVDTDLHKKQHRGIDPRMRLAFEWLWKNCDAAGVWAVDLDLFKFELGYKLEVDTLLKTCPTLRKLPNGSLYHTDFVQVNYGALKPDYNPHKPVFRSLEANGIDPLTLSFQDLTNPSPRVEEEGEGEEEGIQSSENDTKFHEPEIMPPGMSVDLFQAIKRWEQYRKELKKTLTPSGRAQVIAKCEKLGDARAIAAIDHSIAQGWTGMYEPKEQADGKQANDPTGEIAYNAKRQAVAEANAKYYRERDLADGH